MPAPDPGSRGDRLHRHGTTPGHRHRGISARLRSITCQHRALPARSERVTSTWPGGEAGQLQDAQRLKQVGEADSLLLQAQGRGEVVAAEIQVKRLFVGIQARFQLRLRHDPDIGLDKRPLQEAGDQRRVVSQQQAPARVAPAQLDKGGRIEAQRNSGVPGG